MVIEKTDQELVKDCLNGRTDAFAELVRRHQHSVYGLAVGMTRNHHDAADMAQDAFIRAHSKLEQYNPDHPFRSWLLRICANRTKNMFRARTNRKRIEEQHVQQLTTASDSEEPDYEALEEALAKLPPKLNAPLRLKYMENLSYEEISDILGIGVSAAKMRVMRARNQLAELIQ